jgi:hypothetical protein
MDNKQVTEVGKKTQKLIAKVKEVLDISDDACLQFIMLCMVFDVKSIMACEAKSMDEKTRHAIDIIINDEEFKQMLDELFVEINKAKERE